MIRREFITMLGGAAAWPVVGRAQQPGVPVIGILHPITSEANAGNLAALRAGLKEGGYVEGQNLAIEYRYAEGRNDRLPALATDLVRRPVDVIVPQDQLHAYKSIHQTRHRTLTVQTRSCPDVSSLISGKYREFCQFHPSNI